ncbi:MAG: alpha-L-fucosidase [Mucinivorans sp.]
MKKATLALLTLLCWMNIAAAATPIPETLIRPEVREFMDLRLGMFIHFGVNTYTDQEWTDGTVPATVVNPTELDTDSWCAAAADAGMKYIVFTAKHHDGFCNWPSKYTDYSVKNSPCQQDIIASLATSCGKYGLKLGLYYSLWDRNFPHYQDTYLYTEYMKNQLTELLTSYGEILLVWFDGAWDKFAGFKTKDGAQMMQQWRLEGAYNWQWDNIYATIKHLSPRCLVMNNSGIEFPGLPLLPTDVRTGERATKESANKFIWDFGARANYLPMQIEDIASRRFWFYHRGDTTIKTTNQIKTLINDAQAMKANLLLNVGPKENGLLRQEDIELLKTLKK